MSSSGVNELMWFSLSCVYWFKKAPPCWRSKRQMPPPLLLLYYSSLINHIFTSFHSLKRTRRIKSQWGYCTQIDEGATSLVAFCMSKGGAVTLHNQAENKNVHENKNSLLKRRRRPREIPGQKSFIVCGWELCHVGRRKIKWCWNVLFLCRCCTGRLAGVGVYVPSPFRPSSPDALLIKWLPKGDYVCPP